MTLSSLNEPADSREESEAPFSESAIAGHMIEAGVPVSIFNQAHGPLLRDFASALAEAGAKCTMYIGRDWEKASGLPAGIVVHAAPPLNRKSLRTRAVSWFAYSCSAFLRLLKCHRNERVVLFSNPPFLPVLGWLVSRVRGYQYSVVVYDIYPDVLIGMGLARPLHMVPRIWCALNKAAYEAAFSVITLGDVMAAALLKQFDATRTSAGRVIVARPWVDTELIRPRPKAGNPFAIANGQVGFLTVLYSGNMGATHDMDAIVGAARLLVSRCELRFLLIGSGTGLHALEIATRGMMNVKVLPRQPEEQVPDIWAAAEIALITLKPGIEQCSFPSKTAFALSAGCAIVGLTQTPSDLAETIERNDCGMVVNPGDSQGLARCLTKMATDPALLEGYRTRARLTAERLFGRERNTSAMLMGVAGPQA